jgi:hypothetical protein
MNDFRIDDNKKGMGNIVWFFLSGREKEAIIGRYA